jgi:TolB-like protein/DNA-binding winged helix-turn-helix (wHTH) protein/tetratricopeptide (TPR) repeat protein
MQPLAYDSKIVRFGVFQVDLHSGELYKAGLRVKLQQQPLQVLILLLDRPSAVVTREELRAELWPTDTFVDFEHSLNTAVRKLRDALGDVAENPIFIETIPRKGYRFIAPLEMPLTTPAQTLLPLTTPTAEPRVEAGNRKRATVLVLTLAMVTALLGTLGWKIVRDHGVTRGSAPHIRSLAVLPLANLSGDPEQEYFSDGLTEALTNDLGKFSALRVISRTSVMQYKGSKKTVPEIAGDLNVDAVIEGTVLRSGNHLRITVNLIQARPEMHLWAENYDTEAGDLLSVQVKVAQSVARQIQITVTPPEQSLLSSHAVNPAAQDLYFLGLRALGSSTAEAAQNAIGYFQQSIQKDPTYAPAYVGLAAVYGTWYPGESGPRENMPKAREAARKALALDETLPGAHSVMGEIELCYDWNWVGAEKEFKRALELDPNHVVTHNTYARELVILGRTGEAMVHVRQAISLDPYSRGDYPVWISYLARRYDEAGQLAKAKIALDTNDPWNHYDLALVYEQMGKPTESVREYLKFESLSGAEPQTIARLQEAFGKSGARGFWRRRLKEYREAAKSQYVSAGMMAGTCLRAGERDCAFESLEKAFQERDDLMINLNVDPVFDGIRMDRRFQDLLRRVGLPQ